MVTTRPKGENSATKPRTYPNKSHIAPAAHANISYRISQESYRFGNAYAVENMRCTTDHRIGDSTIKKVNGSKIASNKLKAADSKHFPRYFDRVLTPEKEEQISPSLHTAIKEAPRIAVHTISRVASNASETTQVSTSKIAENSLILSEILVEGSI